MSTTVPVLSSWDDVPNYENYFHYLKCKYLSFYQFSQNTQTDHFRSWFTAVHVSVQSHGDKDFPLTSPRAHVLSSTSLTQTGHSFFFMTLSAQNYTIFNPKDIGSTFFWNVGNCQSEWPGQYMIWSHMNIWHAYHQAIWVHSLFWHHLLEAACSLLLEFSTCIHLQIQFQLAGCLHHDATWATAMNINLMDSTGSSEN